MKSISIINFSLKYFLTAIAKDCAHNNATFQISVDQIHQILLIVETWHYKNGWGKYCQKNLENFRRKILNFIVPCFLWKGMFLSCSQMPPNVKDHNLLVKCFFLFVVLLGKKQKNKKLVSKHPPLPSCFWVSHSFIHSFFCRKVAFQHIITDPENQG